MYSFRAIIDAYGQGRLAQAIGVTESHLRTMRARDSIPSEYWSDLIANAPNTLQGLTFDVLRGLRRQRFKKGKAAGDAKQAPAADRAASAYREAAE